MIRAWLLGWIHEGALLLARATEGRHRANPTPSPSYRVVEGEPTTSMDTRVSIELPKIGLKPGMAPPDEKTLREALEKHLERTKRLGDAS